MVVKVGDKVKSKTELDISHDVKIEKGTHGIIVRIDPRPRDVPMANWFGYIVKFEGHENEEYDCLESEIGAA